MKIRWISWLASGLIISTSILPLVARADSKLATYLSPVLAELQLTPSQQTQLEALREQTQSQLENLLTPEQQAQFNNVLSQGNGIRSAARSLNLSFKQRRQMKNIVQTMRSQLERILTPEQRQQIQQSLQTSQQ
jgi:Spy/CpxP family protein refolding chaperone